MAFWDFFKSKDKEQSPFMDFLLGKGEKTQQFQRFSPEQQDVLNQLLGGGKEELGDAFGFLKNILSQNPEAFEAFEAPTRRAFEEKTIPSIAERFSGMNAQKSSAFPQALGKAAAGLEEGLAAQRAGMGQQALAQLQGLLGTGLTPQYENVFRPGSPGLLQTGTESLAKILPFLLML